jgi:hypothetical protein
MLVKTPRRAKSFRRSGGESALARQALERPAPRGVEPRHLLGEMAERDVVMYVVYARSLRARAR